MGHDEPANRGAVSRMPPADSSPIICRAFFGWQSFAICSVLRGSVCMGVCALPGNRVCMFKVQQPPSPNHPSCRIVAVVQQARLLENERPSCPGSV